MEKRIIFFDWDGTLQSTKVSEYANVSRTQVFSKETSEEEIIKLQHNSNNDHYKFVQSLMSQKIPIENKDELRIYQGVIFGAFYLMYVNENKDSILLFDKDKLREFKEENNLEFVIVTSLFDVTMNNTLKFHGIDDLFTVYGCDVTLSTSKYDNLKRAIENEKGAPLAMIGDRGEDVEAGKKFNLKTVYCNYGHGVDSFNADYIVEKSDELIDTIKKII